MRYSSRNSAHLFGVEPREVLALWQDLALLRGLGDLAQLGAADREVVVPVVRVTGFIRDRVGSVGFRFIRVRVIGLKLSMAHLNMPEPAMKQLAPASAHWLGLGL